MCTLKVRGDDPRLPRLALERGLEPVMIVEAGERTDVRSGRRWRRRGDGPQDHGFHCAVSDRAWTDLRGQFEDAVAYVARHREALLALRDLAPRWACLDFPTEVDPERPEVVLFDVTVPLALARATSEVGLEVEVTVYAATSRGSAAEGEADAPPSRMGGPPDQS